MKNWTRRCAEPFRRLGGRAEAAGEMSSFHSFFGGIFGGKASTWYIICIYLFVYLLIYLSSICCIMYIHYIHEYTVLRWAVEFIKLLVRSYGPNIVHPQQTEINIVAWCHALCRLKQSLLLKQHKYHKASRQKARHHQPRVKHQTHFLCTLLIKTQIPAGQCHRQHQPH